MTKIKNFRVALRPREVARWLKKERAIETTPELELEIQSIIKAAASKVTPSAVYTTLQKTIAEKMTSIVLPEGAVALSIMAVSIGPAMAEHRLTQEPGLGEALWAAAEQEALAQSLQFMVRLIHDQAKEEDCEMSTPLAVQDGTVAQALATLLGLSRIGLTFDAAAPQIPSYARVSYAFWVPITKGSSRRAESSGPPACRQAGAEKVAA